MLTQEVLRASVHEVCVKSLPSLPDPMREKWIVLSSVYKEVPIGAAGGGVSRMHPARK